MRAAALRHHVQKPTPRGTGVRPDGQAEGAPHVGAAGRARFCAGAAAEAGGPGSTPLGHGPAATPPPPAARADTAPEGGLAPLRVCRWEPPTVQVTAHDLLEASHRLRKRLALGSRLSARRGLAPPLEARPPRKRAAPPGSAPPPGSRCRTSGACAGGAPRRGRTAQTARRRAAAGAPCRTGAADAGPDTRGPLPREPGDHVGRKWEGAGPLEPRWAWPGRGLLWAMLGPRWAGWGCRLGAGDSPRRLAAQGPHSLHPVPSPCTGNVTVAPAAPPPPSRSEGHTSLTAGQTLQAWVL